MRTIHNKLFQYQVGAFTILVEEENGEFSAYIRGNNYGVYMLMFGARCSSLAEFKKLIRANMFEYMQQYVAEYGEGGAL